MILKKWIKVPSKEKISNQKRNYIEIPHLGVRGQLKTFSKNLVLKMKPYPAPNCNALNE